MRYAAAVAALAADIGDIAAHGQKCDERGIPPVRLRRNAGSPRRQRRDHERGNQEQGDKSSEQEEAHPSLIVQVQRPAKALLAGPRTGALGGGSPKSY